MPSVAEIYYQKLFDISLASIGNKISVGSDFKSQMIQINNVLSNDKTGLISTIFDFMVKSGNVDIKFTTSNPTLAKVFDDWKENLNEGLNIDIPRGLRNFTEQFLRERWKSSFLVIRIRWENKNGYIMPTQIWLMDGASIEVENEEKALNTNKYFYKSKKAKDGKQYLDKGSLKTNETVLVRKPFNYWYDQYPTPYLVRRGVLFHALKKTMILDKQAEIINAAFPYQLWLKIGSPEAMQRSQMPTQKEMDDLLDKLQTAKNNYDEKTFSKALAGAFRHDVNLQELIPDFKKALDSDIVKATDKDILSGLGLIELKGFSSTREEAILNPKVLVEEVEDAVTDYVDFLQEIVRLIQEKNSSKYTVNTSVEVRPDVIKSFLTDEMKVLIRSWYDRGLIGYTDALESTTPLKFKSQVIQRKQEFRDGITDVCWPRLTQNQEQYSDPNEDNIPDDKKPNSPESKNFKNANSLTVCKNCEAEIEYGEEPEIKMGYIKCPFCGLTIDQEGNFYTSEQEYIEAPYTVDNAPVKNVLPMGALVIWVKTFNKVLKETGDEDQARQAAWSNVKRKYHKVGTKWIKKTNVSAMKDLEIIQKSNEIELQDKKIKFFNKLLKENKNENI